ncbi:MAG: ParB/RepB/Spo0J family partition protein [Oscillibacter sp.]|nr:ParB/RepB/Spo0J family partition protein [Oscillibacter sp.]
MPDKKGMGGLLKKRMAETRRTSELVASDEVYEKIFRKTPPADSPVLANLALDKLVPFFTEDIGFKPYPPERLNALAEQIKEDGLLVRIIARKTPDGDRYEILAGHNRVNAAKLAGWTEIPAEVVEADDARAIVIATSTNLIQRQNLSIVERGKAYKALLEAKNRNGQRDAASVAFGDNRQRYNARQLVAKFFNVSEYEIRKAVKLTRLIPELLDILDSAPKQLQVVCANLIADYGADSQTAFIPMCSEKGYRLNKATVQRIIKKCPPPNARAEDIVAAWREARAIEENQSASQPDTITFDRKKFAPLLDKLGEDVNLEEFFLKLLRQAVSG